MNKIIGVFILNVITATSFAQNSVGIGTSTPNTSAILEISSGNKGLLTPRMTTAQRNAISTPAKGLLVYDTDLNALYHFNGSAWATVGAGGGGNFTLPYDATVNLNTAAFKITNSGTGAAIQAVTTNEFGFGLQANNTTNFGYSVYAFSRSPNAIGVYALGDSSIAVKGESGKGIGVDAISTDSTALRARISKGANADPVILATHAGVGIAVDASSNTGAAIRGTSNASGGILGAVVGINNHPTSGNGVYGNASGSSGVGVRGETNAGTGLLGYSGSGIGVSASSLSGTALKGSSISGYALDVSGKVQISGGNTNPAAGAVLTSIDASGNAVWKSNRIAFRATGVRLSQNTITLGTFKRIHFSQEDFDYGNSFNVLLTDAPDANSSVFTAPVSGVYQFNASALARGAINTDLGQATMAIKLNRNGAIETLAEIEGYDRYSNAIIDAYDDGIFSTSVTVKLNAGDKVYVEIYLDATPATIKPDYTQFSGFLVFED